MSEFANSRKGERKKGCSRPTTRSCDSWPSAWPVALIWEGMHVSPLQLFSSRSKHLTPSRCLLPSRLAWIDNVTSLTRGHHHWCLCITWHPLCYHQPERRWSSQIQSTPVFLSNGTRWCTLFWTWVMEGEIVYDSPWIYQLSSRIMFTQLLLLVLMFSLLLFCL